MEAPPRNQLLAALADPLQAASRGWNAAVAPPLSAAAPGSDACDVCAAAARERCCVTPSGEHLALCASCAAGLPGLPMRPGCPECDGSWVGDAGALQFASAARGGAAAPRSRHYGNTLLRL